MVVRDFRDRLLSLNVPSLDLRPENPADIGVDSRLLIVGPIND